MTKLEKVLGLFLTCVLIAVFCLIVMLRRDRESLEAAGQESAELRAQNQDLDARLATLTDELSRQQSIQPAVGLIAGQPQTNDFTEVNRRLDHLAAQQSNILALLPNSVAANSLIETPSQKHQNYQQAVTALSAKAAKQEEKSHSARLRLEQLITSLNVPDEVAAVDDDTGLSVPGLRAYWPFFEARREWKDTDDMLRILNRRLQVTEIDMGIEPVPASENSK